MPINIKELIVVLGLSALVFGLGKGTALHFMEEADFKRRRNIWLLLSAAAFLSPNFWLFALVAVPALYWGGRKDTNPLGLYLLLMNVIPSIPIEIPTSGLGINQLFDLDIFRLLSLCVLVPAALRLRKSQEPDRTRTLRGMDLLLIGYGILSVVLYVPPDVPGQLYQHTSFTNALREALLFVIDIYVLYYVTSRSCSSRRAILDALAAFCLSCTIMALVAIFESAKHWLLYTDLYHQWGGDLLSQQYLFRSGLVRAEASSGNILALGYLLAIAFGFWLYLQSQVQRLGPRIAITVVLLLGLVASFARGPMLGAVVIYFAYATLRPLSISRLLKSALVFIAVAGVVVASPIGQRIVSSLPFMGGNVARGTFTYRELVLDRSWQLIDAHPVLGDQHAYVELQDLRQGQGIIDLVDTYVEVTLFHGFLGLSIFLAMILGALFKAYAAARKTARSNSDCPLIGAALGACIVGTLVMLADCSFILGYVPIFYFLIGIVCAYSRLITAHETSAAMTPTSPAPI